MPRQVFTAGEILTAANMNDLSDQTVMVFDDSAARGSAIPTPAEGMVTYLKDTNLVEAYTGAAFEAVSQPGILQVLSTTKTDSFGSASTTGQDIPGLSLTITPSATSSKILLLASVTLGHNVFAVSQVFAFRGATQIALADGGANPGSITTDVDSADFMRAGSIIHLDSPSTTSATTYKLQFRTNGNTGYVNRRGANTDSRPVSSLTLMEVAG